VVSRLIPIINNHLFRSAPRLGVVSPTAPFVAIFLVGGFYDSGTSTRYHWAEAGGVSVVGAGRHGRTDPPASASA
jgi:hypothetical protein